MIHSSIFHLQIFIVLLQARHYQCKGEHETSLPQGIHNLETLFFFKRSKLFFSFKKIIFSFIYISWRLITLQYYSGFAIH